MSQRCAGRPVIEHDVKRPFDLDPTRDVQKEPVRPERRVQRRELSIRRHYGVGHEMLLNEVRVRLRGRRQIGENHAARAQRVVSAILDHLAVYEHQRAALSAADKGLPCILRNNLHSYITCLNKLTSGRPRHTADIRPAPVLVGAAGHRDGLVGIPRVQAEVTQPLRFIVTLAERLDILDCIRRADRPTCAYCVRYH